MKPLKTKSPPQLPPMPPIQFADYAVCGSANGSMQASAIGKWTIGGRDRH